MAFQLGDDDSQGMSEMNLVPLIDIMLVLMIIFLVTSTVLNPTIPLTLPKTDASASLDTEAEIIQISIDENNEIFLDKQPMSLEELSTKISTMKKDTVQDTTDNNQPTLMISAHKDSKYDTIAKVLAKAGNAGLTNIAFESDIPD